MTKPLFARSLVRAGLFLMFASSMWAQSCSGDTSVGCLIPELFGKDGLTLGNPFHRAHFDSDFQQNFTPLNSAVATQLALLPLASPASGYTFSFDKSAGVYTRSSQTFGPILTERAETIGRRKLFIGFTFQHYSFDKLDGFDLNSFPAVFRHVQETGAAYEQDFIFTNNTINLTINQSTVFATYGLTDRLDFSVAIPFMNVQGKMTSDATIIRIAPPSAQFGQAHYFNAADPDGSTQARFTDSSNSTGIGDVTLRGKLNLVRNDRAGLAVALDVRLPSGDERNFQGAGAAGVKPFLIASTRIGRFAPHANIGYQWNGESVLAGNISMGTKASLPNQFMWALGSDLRAHKAVTLALDVIGQRAIDAPHLFQGTYVSAGNYFTLPEARVETRSFNIVNGSAGVKVSLGGNFLATANVLIKLNDGGLRDNLSPLFGLSYAF